MRVDAYLGDDEPGEDDDTAGGMPLCTGPNCTPWLSPYCPATIPTVGDSCAGLNPNNTTECVYCWAGDETQGIGMECFPNGTWFEWGSIIDCT